MQKAFYSLLLERRLGEHRLPPGTWFVAAGNRLEDRAMVRAMSSALINRVIIIHLRVDTKEWLRWAVSNGIRNEIVAFINFMPEALMRPVSAEAAPFSTPRSWTLLSRALDLQEAAGVLPQGIRRSLAFGLLTAEDAAIFCSMAEERMGDILPLRRYIEDSFLIAFVLSCRGRTCAASRLKPSAISSGACRSSTGLRC